MSNRHVYKRAHTPRSATGPPLDITLCSVPLRPDSVPGPAPTSAWKTMSAQLTSFWSIKVCCTLLGTLRIMRRRIYRSTVKFTALKPPMLGLMSDLANGGSCR